MNYRKLSANFHEFYFNLRKIHGKFTTIRVKIKKRELPQIIRELS